MQILGDFLFWLAVAAFVVWLAGLIVSCIIGSEDDDE